MTRVGEIGDAQPLRRDWQNQLARAGSGGIYLHPEWVLSLPDRDQSVLYVGPHAPEGGGASPCLALLRPKSIHLGRRGRLPGLLSLHGFYLVRDQLLGETNGTGARAFVDDLIGWLDSRETRAEFVLFEDTLVDSPLWKCLQEASKDGRAAVWYPYPPQAHYFIRFPDPPELYWKRFSGKARYNLRAAARKLPHRVIQYTRPEQVAEFLARANAISGRSWQGKRLGLRMQDSPESRREYGFLAAQGAWRSYILEHEDQPLAFQLGFQWNGCFMLEETGYVQAYAHQSPGSVLMFRVVEDLLAHQTPSLCDFGAGDGAYKRFYGTEQTVSGPVLLVRRSPRTRAVLGLHRLSRGAGRGLRTLLKGLRLHSYVRNLYRKVRPR